MFGINKGGWHAKEGAEIIMITGGYIRICAQPFYNPMQAWYLQADPPFFLARK